MAATGINRGSLYTAFTDKRTLFLRALERYDRVHRRDFLADVAAGLPPRDAIVAVFVITTYITVSKFGDALGVELEPMFDGVEPVLTIDH